MADYSNVFQSEIARSQRHNVNNLHELLNVSPAVPAHVHKEVIDFHFVPKTDKQYVPKKRSKLKVKSVRDLRETFEKDVMSYLPGEIEKQEECLFKKIKAGSAKDRHTKSIAKKMLMSDRPISKSVLQMLMNINPDDQTYNVQYVLYKGKKIRINGSTGGKELIRFDCDLSGKKVSHKKIRKSTNLKKKKGLLQNSLAVQFKPGPLVKKKTLDVSYQKYNVGATELVNLPQPVLCLQPVPGVALEPSISKFVQNLCDDDGTISEKWAEFSVSAVHNSDSKIAHNERDVTFDLNYTCNQKRILMRRDIDSICNISHKKDTPETSHSSEDLLCEIKIVISKLLDAVEIHELQDDLYTKDDNVVEDFHESPIKLADTETLPKDKKKRRFIELDKLDVTVIQLPDEVLLEEKKEACTNSFCALGCICPSLQNPYNIKQHCGRIKCMFKCQCNFSKYAVDSFGNSFINLESGIINLDKEINCQLAKEEKKFHQTVVVTGNKSIVLKTQKRTCKVSKRYADFYSDTSSKTDIKLQQEVSVELAKLNCENIETWCMVHRLYRCFCKGKFTHCTVTELDEANITTEHNPKDETHQLNPGESNNNMNPPKYNPTPEKVNHFKDYTFSESDRNEIDFEQFTEHCNRDRCARAMTYKRKYRDSFYSEMQNKIIEMEKNDESLRKRMQQLVNAQSTSHNSQASERLAQSKGKVNQPQTDTVPALYQNTGPTAQGEMKNSSLSVDNNSQSTSNPALLSNQSAQIEQKDLARFIGSEEVKKPTQDRAKLIAWLENSYKQYKRRSDQGKIVLEPPKNKKLVIYPWDFILSRYKEKKNIFLVTKNMPFRLFMAVDTKNSFFENCININGIQLADLHKYPVTVQRLLTSATDFDDNFCILLGLSCCWEFVGSLSKVGEGTPKCSLADEQHQSVCEISDDSDTLHLDEDDENDNKITQRTSKWFVLMVEADFGEIQFSEKGFFVRYQSIIKAVNVARLSGKTVRLSSQKTVNETNSPQFGVYAIPATHDYCVFVGPYQDGDALGIEIIKSSTGHSKSPTKGFWISTNRDENFEVIEDPLSFLPTNRDSIAYVTLDDISERLPATSASVMRQSFCKSAIPTATSKSNTLFNPPLRLASTSSGDTSKDDVKHVTSDVSSAKTRIVVASKSCLLSEQIKKPTTIRPIRISKENGFYKILPKGGFPSLTSLLNPGTSRLNPISAVKPVDSVLDHQKTMSPIYATSSSTSIASKNHFVPLTDKIKPIAEIAPQIKIVDVYSESTTQPQQSSQRNANTGRGMFVLKPEEINKRLMKATDNNTSDQRIDEDIENFLATTANVRIPPNSILMDSDDEDRSQNLNIKDIFIESKTVEYLGWIKGKIDEKSHISFKFPGFAYTKFYPESEAYAKINQVLSRKVYVPRSINLEWKIVTTPEELKTKKMLTSEQLGVDFVLTRRGLKHRGDIITYSAGSILRPSKATSSVAEQPTTALSERVREVEKASEALIDQECRSEEMEDRNDQLLQELTTATQPEVYRKNPITNELTPTQRDLIAERLQDLLASTDDD